MDSPETQIWLFCFLPAMCFFLIFHVIIPYSSSNFWAARKLEKAQSNATSLFFKHVGRAAGWDLLQCPPILPRPPRFPALVGIMQSHPAAVPPAKTSQQLLHNHTEAGKLWDGERLEGIGGDPIQQPSSPHQCFPHWHNPCQWRGSAEIVCGGAALIPKGVLPFPAPLCGYGKHERILGLPVQGW